MANTHNNSIPLIIEEDFANLFQQYVQTEHKIGSIVRGKVIGIDNSAVIIDVGLKSEGRIPLSEFTIEGRREIPNIGDEVEVLIERLEGRQGNIILSREKARNIGLWQRLEEIHKENATIDGKIIGRLKGGFAVELEGGLIAFLPGSQADVRPIKDIAPMLNVKQTFKILKMDKEHGNVVVSRRVILEESRKEAREELLSQIKVGMLLKGIVKNITDYGAFIDLRALDRTTDSEGNSGADRSSSADGLLHITDMSWYKISHPSQLLKVGQEIDVMVIQYNAETQRISLGLKQLEKNPWEDIKDKYHPGSIHSGKVTAIMDYGAFVNLDANVDGLVYYTEINWTAKNIHPSKLVKIGDDVEVMILDIDINRHRISLSMKQCKPNPWKQFAKDYPVGNDIEVVVKEISELGIFSVLKGEEDNELALKILIPIGELSWDQESSEAIKDYKPGDVIRCMVQNVDIDKERVLASIKQLTSDPAVALATKLIAAPSVFGKVADIRKEGIVLSLPDTDLKVFVERNELSRHRDEQNTRQYSLGDEVEVKVLNFDRKNKIFIGSMRVLQTELEARTMAEYSSSSKGSSLGALLDSALQQGGQQKEDDE